MFGTSGIRGIYGDDITEALAGRISSIFAKGTLAIGRDIRDSGISLLNASIAGAISQSADVIDLGIVPTPTVALSSKKHRARAIMLTASHNPPQYNGLKLIENGKEIGKAMEKEITRAYREWSPGSGADGAEKGALFHDVSIVEDHKAMVCGMIDTGLIAKRKPKVLVDCNGAASVITPQLLTDLGCRVMSVNASPYCFNRPSEPSAANLAYLSGLVRGGGFDFAIAHDGDGDRCMIIDERGDALPLDAQLAMMIEHELAGAKKGKRVISTVEASLVIREVVERSGAEIDITPVGSTSIGDLMENNGALFGGEPCGEYIFSKGVHVPDAVLAAAKFTQIFCEMGQFSKLKALYPQRFMARERFPAKDKLAAMEKIRARVEGMGLEGTARCDDGIRLDEKDGWFLIRASGTEPIIRLTMEYVTKAKLEERKAQMIRHIKDCAV